MRCRIVSRTFAPQAALIALLSSAALADPAAPDSAPNGDAATEAATLSPELREALQDLLNYDPVRASSGRASPLRTPAQSSDLDWNRSEKNDGSAAVSVKKALPLPWDAKVGADLAPATNPAMTYRPDRPQQSAKDTGSGAAWANVTVVPGLASVDARVDPGREQGRIGTTFSHSVPLGSSYSITLQNSYALTDTFSGTQAAPAAPGAPAALPPSQVWSNDKLVKFNILSTGTSLAAGTTSSSIDNVTRNKFSAEQKLFENFNVTTSVTDVGAPVSNKSITAGFKLKW